MNERNQEQPHPVSNGHPACWDLVKHSNYGGFYLECVADMRDRDQIGFKRYGVRIQPFNGRDQLVDAYQEALDLCVYLRAAVFEMDSRADSTLDMAVSVYHTALDNALQIRTLLWKRDRR
jgi:hypothetical protein